MRYRLFKEKNRATGEYYPKWKIAYYDNSRIIKRETGYTEKSLTRKKAERNVELLEIEKTDLKKGIVKKSYPELIEEYIARKSPKGGWKGSPWSAEQIKRTRKELEWWGESLSIKDISRIRLGDVETTIEKRVGRGGALSGKSKNWVVSKLNAFLVWALKNKYLQANPLEGWENYREQNLDPKRALNQEELSRLWTVIDIHKKMAYMTAMITGMRRKEIVSLTVGDLDLVRGGINLKWENEKRKQGAFFHLPESYLISLSTYIKGAKLTDKLFRVSIHHASENLRRDLKKANIEFKNDKGKIVFHSFRKTFLTRLSQIGNDAKTVQRLGRHSDPNVTFGIYVDASDKMEKQTIENLYSDFSNDRKRIGQPSDLVSDADGIGLQKVPPRRIEGQADNSDNQRHSQTNADIAQTKRKVAKFLGLSQTRTNPDNQRRSIRSDIDLSLLIYAMELLKELEGPQLNELITWLEAKRIKEA